MRKFKVAFWIAAAALLVNTPRFIQVFLKVDGLALPQQWEATLLVATALGTGGVLTGGGMFLMHAIATPTRAAGWRIVLVCCWLALLLFTVVLIAPMLVYGVQQTDFVDVLATPTTQWTFAIVAVLSVEVIAGGAMIAHTVLHTDSNTSSRRRDRGALGTITDALTRRAVDAITPDAVSNTTGDTTDTQGIDTTPEQAAHARSVKADRDSRTIEQRREHLLDILSSEPDTPITQIADRLDVSRSTVYNDLDRLETQGRVHKNGDGYTVTGG